MENECEIWREKELQPWSFKNKKENEEETKKREGKKIKRNKEEII